MSDKVDIVINDSQVIRNGITENTNFYKTSKEIYTTIMTFMVLFCFVYLCVFSLKPTIFMQIKPIREEDEPEMEYNIGRIFIVSVLFSCVVLLVSWLSKITT